MKTTTPILLIAIILLTVQITNADVAVDSSHQVYRPGLVTCTTQISFNSAADDGGALADKVLIARMLAGTMPESGCMSVPASHLHTSMVYPYEMSVALLPERLGLSLTARRNSGHSRISV